MTIKFPIKGRVSILALGAESAGVFAVYENGDTFVSKNFGDLMDENNFLKYKKEVLAYIKRERVKPNIILTDMHPLYNSAAFGAELARKYRIPHIKVQHHIAHIFSAIGDYMSNSKFKIQNSKFPNNFVGIAMDGTGYGLDGNIWGGEVFRIKIPNPKIPASPQLQRGEQIPNKSQNPNSKIQAIRIGSLEEQTMIGGDAAVREPARILISILDKLQIPNYKSQIKSKFQIPNSQKKFIYSFVRKFYTRNEFEVLYNQLEQNFNCQKTTSTGRILDAVSVLLGFAGNERKFKHEAAKKLEENSTVSYNDCDLRFSAKGGSAFGGKVHDLRIILDTTHLFEYLIKNYNRDKKRLAATAQLYIAKGLYKIIQLQTTNYSLLTIFATGGMANNKIISSYLENHGVYLSKKIPRGDEGIAVGQIVHYLLNNK